MSKLILITYGKKSVPTYDMGGFPDERFIEDKSNIIVVTKVSKNDMEFAFDFDLLPFSKTRVMAHPELTEQQITKTLIGYLDFINEIDK
jgi:hypothetical protein